MQTDQETIQELVRRGGAFVLSIRAAAAECPRHDLARPLLNAAASAIDAALLLVSEAGTMLDVRPMQSIETAAPAKSKHDFGMGMVGNCMRCGQPAETVIGEWCPGTKALGGMRW